MKKETVNNKQKNKSDYKKLTEEIGKFIIVLASMFVMPIILEDIIKFMGIKGNLSTILAYVIYIVILFFVYTRDFIKEWKTFKKNFKKCIDQGFKYWIFGYLVMAISNAFLYYLVFKNLPANEAQLRELIVEAPIFSFLTMVMFGPITEEIIFRKGLRGIFKNGEAYAITSGLIFGFMHVLVDLSWIKLLYIIPYGALGYGFAKACYKTDSTFTPILMHIFHNLIAFALALLVSTV